jgi:hypothetical protein
MGIEAGALSRFTVLEKTPRNSGAQSITARHLSLLRRFVKRRRSVVWDLSSRALACSQDVQPRAVRDQLSYMHADTIGVQLQHGEAVDARQLHTD